MLSMFIQTNNIKKTAQELDSMLHEIIMKSGIFVPLSKTTFRYKDYLVVKSEDGGWHCFKVADGRKKHIATTFLKITAFALCKAHEKRHARTVDELLSCDRVFEKNYIDSLFYKKTIKSSTDDVSKDTALWRYEIVHSKAKHAKDRIDGIFYMSIA
jgi:hypothetical protein